jgi:hypothetical protein
MHTATLALIEALLIGVAVKCPSETISNLKLLNDLRAPLVGKPMDLPLPGPRLQLFPQKASTASKVEDQGHFLVSPVAELRSSVRSRSIPRSNI